MVKEGLSKKEATKLYGESINEMKFDEQCEILKEYPHLMEFIKDQTDELQEYLVNKEYGNAKYIINLNNKLQKN